MNFDSAADKLKGQVKETAGKLSGDAETQVDGLLDKVEGEVKEKLEDAKGALKAVTDRLTGDN